MGIHGIVHLCQVPYQGFGIPEHMMVDPLQEEGTAIFDIDDKGIVNMAMHEFIDGSRFRVKAVELEYFSEVVFFHLFPPQVRRVFPFVDQAVNAVDGFRFIFFVGYTEPGEVGFQHFYAHDVIVHQVVDPAGQVVLRF
jgi:hypothetical protein